MNDSEIHRSKKIALNDGAVKVGCRDWSGLPLNASESISEQALSSVHSRGGRCNFWGLLHCNDRNRHDELAAMDLSMTAVTLTSLWFCMNFNSYGSLDVFSSFVVSDCFCFVSKHETI